MGDPSFNPYEGHHMLHAFKGLLMPTAVSKLLEEDRNALDPVEAVQLRRVFDHFLPGRKRVQDSSAPPEDVYYLPPCLEGAFKIKFLKRKRS